MDIYKIVKGNSFTLHIKMQKTYIGQNQHSLEDVDFTNVANLSISLTNIFGESIEIPSSDILTVSNTELSVFLPKNLDEGLYGIAITGTYDDYAVCCRDPKLIKVVTNNAKSAIPLGIIKGEIGGFYQATYWIELQETTNATFLYGALAAKSTSEVVLKDLNRANNELLDKSIAIETTADKPYIWFVSKSLLQFKQAGFTASLNHTTVGELNYYWTDELVAGNDNEYTVSIQE